ncbi:ATP-binding protein [Neobacillus sp. Marseille-QA0830]
MKRSGQVILVLVSILFTLYQKIAHQREFFTFDFFLFTIIAWFVGWQYDKARYYEKTARASEENYKKLLDSLPESVAIHRDHHIIYINQSAVMMLGANHKEELIGKSIHEYIHPEYNGRLEERIKQAKKENKPLNNIVYRLRRQDGTQFFYEVSSITIQFEHEAAVLTIGKDITKSKEQNDLMLQKSEKLALLGQMAAGIAHEIRNPLTSIRGFIQLFKYNQMNEEYYDVVLSELDRINAIVGEFLVLAKPSAAVFVEQDVSELIKEVITLSNTQSILNNVEIEVDFDEGLPKVFCEENQIKQVILNLIKNAMEAMPKGGKIFVAIKAMQEGQISIRIQDQGIGIPKERIPTLGEPFYTTKEKGTGLGLMTCYKIIENHNGKLSIQSAVNEGTTVEIILPTVTQPLLTHN